MVITMTMADKLLLGVNTAVIGMGIVFLVLIVLWVAIAAQSKLISYCTGRFKKPEIEDSPGKEKEGGLAGQGVTSGECLVAGSIDDEILAVIMAVSSNYADTPLSELQFKSIKAL